MKILDGDHCVALLRGRLSLQGKVSAAETLAVTAISVGELAHGAHKSRHATDNLAQLDLLLSSLLILPFTESAARRFATLKAELEAAGTPLGDLDLQIASTALDHDAPLITHNAQHLHRVPGLLLEDWLI